MSFARFAHDLRARRGRHGVVVLSAVESTNDLAKRIVREYAREDDPPPSIDFVAWDQQAGRGRDDRAWHSRPGGGVYASMVRPLRAPEAVSALPVAVAVGLATVLNEQLDGRCTLKWPNDVLVGDRKLGGVLIEVVGINDDGGGGAVIGFGINTHADVAKESALNATSMAHETGTTVDLAAMAAALLDGVDASLDAPFDRLLDAYRTLSAHQAGDRLRLRGLEAPIEGTFLGFDDRGFLRLETKAGKERVLAAGELHD